MKRKDILSSLGCELGQRETLSDLDIRKINTMYKVHFKREKNLTRKTHFSQITNLVFLTYWILSLLK